jgi:hypothetical protein
MAASAQQTNPPAGGDTAGGPGNVPPTVQRAEAQVEETARRYRLGVHGGVGLDPELVDVGVHGMIGPIFRPAVAFRPGLEIGLGEVTTLLAINLDVLYTFPGVTRDTRWAPYVGAGPTFGLSHRGFETDNGEHVDVEGLDDALVERNRFDFSDTDFNAGLNLIVGMRRQNNVFFEMKATAGGVANVRLVAGVSF